METVSDAMVMVADLFEDIYDECGSIIDYSNEIQTLDAVVADECSFYTSIAGTHSLTHCYITLRN